MLTHNGGVLTSENQDTKSFKYNVITKEVLKDYGFNPTTIILAGGTGQDTIDFLQAEKWSRMYYKMSDKYGQVEPYYHPRMGFSSYSSLNSFKTAVDNAITNHSWVVFYMHGIDKETQVATYLNSALEYVNEKVQTGDAEIKTYSEVYGAYYRNDPHLYGTGYIGTNEKLTWTYEEDTINVVNHYAYGGVEVVSITASEYHASDTNTIIFKHNKNTSVGFNTGCFSSFIGCTEFIVEGLNNPRNSAIQNSYLPNTVTSIKVSWDISAGAITPATIGADPNATVTYNYTP